MLAAVTDHGKVTAAAIANPSASGASRARSESLSTSVDRAAPDMHADLYTLAGSSDNRPSQNAAASDACGADRKSPSACPSQSVSPCVHRHIRTAWTSGRFKFPGPSSSSPGNSATRAASCPRPIARPTFDASVAPVRFVQENHSLLQTRRHDPRHPLSGAAARAGQTGARGSRCDLRRRGGPPRRFAAFRAVRRRRAFGRGSETDLGPGSALVTACARWSRDTEVIYKLTAPYDPDERARHRMGRSGYRDRVADRSNGAAPVRPRPAASAPCRGRRNISDMHRANHWAWNDHAHRRDRRGRFHRVGRVPVPDRPDRARRLQYRQAHLCRQSRLAA